MSDRPFLPYEGARYAFVILDHGRCDTCMDCGALVLDQKIHDRWHHDLADSVAAIVIEAVIEANTRTEARRG